MNHIETELEFQKMDSSFFSENFHASMGLYKKSPSFSNGPDMAQEWSKGDFLVVDD